jgi:hypothetical protein
MAQPKPLDPVSLAFLRTLLDRAERFRFRSRRNYTPKRLDRALTTYKELIVASGLSTRGTGGIPCRKAGLYLGRVAEFCQAHDLPCLNALVVNGKTREPGGSLLLTRGAPHWTAEATACLYVKFEAQKLIALATPDPHSGPSSESEPQPIAA